MAADRWSGRSAGRLVERVEGVEELLLHCFLALEEMHVVDEQQVGLAKAAPEIRGGSVLNRGDELVGELLGTDERDPGFGLPLRRSRARWPA